MIFGWSIPANTHISSCNAKSSFLWVSFDLSYIFNAILCPVFLWTALCTFANDPFPILKPILKSSVILNAGSIPYCFCFAMNSIKSSFISSSDFLGTAIDSYRFSFRCFFGDVYSRGLVATFMIAVAGLAAVVVDGVCALNIYKSL